MLIAYVCLAIWFWFIDMFAGELGGVKARPIAALLLASVWPISVAFALCASAIIIARLRRGVP